MTEMHDNRNVLKLIYMHMFKFMTFITIERLRWWTCKLVSLPCEDLNPTMNKVFL